MNTRSILAALAGGIFSFLLGWLVFGFLLMNFYEVNSIHYDGLMKEVPDILLIFFANFSTAFLLAFIFQRWAGIKTIGRGFLAGLLISFLITLMIDLYFMASMNLYTTKLVIIDIIVNTVFGGILGGFIAWILGLGKKSAA